MDILSVADVPADPNSGAAGTIIQTNHALRDLGHHVDEIWSRDLGERRIKHGNLHSLLEQPLLYRKAIRTANRSRGYDATLVQQPQAYLAAKDRKVSKRGGAIFTVSQGVETRIEPILRQWRQRLGDDDQSALRSHASAALQRLLVRQWVLTARYSDGIIVQHSQDKVFVCEEYGLAQERVHVSASGVPQQYLDSPPLDMDSRRLRRLLFVGQFAFFKAPRILARIVNALLARDAERTFTWVCGAAAHEQALELIDPAMRARVSMRDWVSQAELMPILDEHGVFLFPTLAEGFAKAPLEAMSRGLCVIASDCCGMADYIAHGKSGFLCKIGDSESFVEFASGLLTNLDLAVRTSRLARREAERYTWNDSAQKLLRYIAAT